MFASPPATAATLPVPVPAPAPVGAPDAHPATLTWPAGEQRGQPGRRRVWVSRLVLLAVMALQSYLSLRMRNSASADEALCLYAGRMELLHLLHGTPLQGTYPANLSGAPVLYPVLAAAANAAGGLAAARAVSTLAMAWTTGLLYGLTRRLFGERAALCAALLFAVSEPAVLLANLATGDAPALLLLAAAAWLVVWGAGRAWPLCLLAAPAAALAVGAEYATLPFAASIAVLAGLAAQPRAGRRAFIPAITVAAATGALLATAGILAGPRYLAAFRGAISSPTHGGAATGSVLREAAAWGGVLFVMAVYGAVAYTRREFTEPGGRAAIAGGAPRRAALGAALAGTALLAPVAQIWQHTGMSLDTGIGFGLFFAAPIAGVGLARVIGDHFRRPQFGIAIWGLALMLGMSQASAIYHSWPNSARFVAALARHLKPAGRYLVEEPAVPIYYLQGRAGALPSQFSATSGVAYPGAAGHRLTSVSGLQAAVAAGEFDLVAYRGAATPAIDGALAAALARNRDYQLASVIPVTQSSGPGAWYIWVKAASPRRGRAAPRARHRRSHRRRHRAFVPPLP